MRHRKFQELIGAYADGELRETDRSRVEKHLQACPACRRDLDFIRDLDRLPKTSPAVPREADYWASFSGRVRAGIDRRQAGAPASRVAEVEMFKDSFYHPESRARTRAAIFPLSLAAHAAILLLLIVLPLMRTGDLPTVEVYSAFLAPPPPPPPPPP
ncbi:MAG: zf-HC2 domain-containing protein, partial [Acidobacteria bacterium]|nr:zf-HC2 domain-containing protein [Acidobacteriota bacterium]